MIPIIPSCCAASRPRKRAASVSYPRMLESIDFLLTDVFPSVTETDAQDVQERTSALEQAWVRQAQQGDLSAFNAIVERYQQAAYNLALRMLRDQSLAEDVTQEAFFSAYRNINKYRGGSLKSWMLTIVANRARDRISALRIHERAADKYPHPRLRAGP